MLETLKTFLVKLDAATTGLKTYAAAFGLLLLGVLRIRDGQTDAGVQDVLAALAALGLRDAVAKAAAPTPPAA